MNHNAIIRRTRTGVLFLVTTTIFLSTACGQPDAVPENSGAAETFTPVYGTVTPAVPSTPIVPTNIPSTPNPDDPFILNVQGAFATAPIFPEMLVKKAEIIVTARVVEILPAQWTTPDGQRPANPWETVPDQFTIVTPILIELVGAPLLVAASADVADGRLVIAADGGHVGPDAVLTNFPWDAFKVGERILVSLSRGRRIGPEGLIATSQGPGWSVGMSYVLTNDGMAVSYGGAVSQPAAELIAAIIAAVR